MNTSDLEIVRKIAEALRRHISQCERHDVTGECHDASNALVAKLKRAGISARRVQGNYYVDDPDPGQYDDDADEEGMHYPVHHWVEVGRDTVVDVTADQFRHEVDEEIPSVVIGKRRDLPRYVAPKKRRGG